MEISLKEREQTFQNERKKFRSINSMNLYQNDWKSRTTRIFLLLDDSGRLIIEKEMTLLTI